MMRTLFRSRRWLLGLATGGLLLQAETVGCDPAAVASTVLAPQVANLIADTVFFLMDNVLVRLTT